MLGYGILTIKDAGPPITEVGQAELTFRKARTGRMRVVTECTTEKCLSSEADLYLGQTLLFVPVARSHILDALMKLGCATEDAARVWTAATTEPGPDGDRARLMIERATNIQIVRRHDRGRPAATDLTLPGTPATA
jgi:hypothetical protein